MRQKKQASGFTLIELLVVITIIVIASSIIIMGTGGGQGAALRSSQRILSGLAQGVRGQALLKHEKARLIIYADTGSDREDDKYLRFFGIVYQDPEDTTGDSWIAANQGTYLPEGIYFDAGLSRLGNGSNSIPTMQLEYPLQSPQSAGSGPSYYYYEFESNGTMSTSQTDFENSWLVIRAGVFKPDSSGNLDVVFDDPELENLKSALIFRRVGTTTMVTDPANI
ncbi:type II secretion system protein [Coraliomargarita parva]|uniref:type II secretion system protein n=1 Tax=Coraliomargarita parva TaxID=3014050 RepID=UPI0022B3CCA0|nr:prepilin-type N-terminal cleavage/methylation domain-containing protein [Coraliomargarita parva]